jgi:hypothetical protein
MRCDADLIIFVLQGRSTEAKGKRDWFSPSYDHFGHPPGFNASGECWQKTGIHGTFDEDEGLAALRVFNREHVEYDWRLIRMHVVQEHIEVARFNAKKPGQKSPSTNPYPTKEDEEVYRRARAVAAG